MPEVLNAVSAIAFFFLAIGGLRVREELDPTGESTLALCIALAVFNAAAVFAQ